MVNFYELFFFFRMCLEFRRINFESEPVYKELHRKLNCASYNALIAVVSCTQNDLKFYNAFLFKENPMKVCNKYRLLLFILFLIITNICAYIKVDFLLMGCKY